ncbi:MAG: phospholipase D-like domain-containing protein [Candidatus Uhrbacteria bacterium]
MRTRIFALVCTLLLTGNAWGLIFYDGWPIGRTDTAPFELVISVPKGTEDVIDRGNIRDPTSVWVELIDRAERSIDFAFFYVTSIPNESLGLVLDAIERAGKRGVPMRFIVDKKMTKVTRNDDADGLRRLAAIPSLRLMFIDYETIAGGVHHPKYFIVDGRDAYLGSQNFDWRALSHIHELGIRTNDACTVTNLSAVFEHDWQKQLALTHGSDYVASATPYPICAVSCAEPRLAASPPSQTPVGMQDAEAALLALIGQTKKELAIEVMTYSLKRRSGGAYRTLDNALRAAARRGVHVMLMVDAKRAESHYDALFSLATEDGIDVRAVSIPEQQEAFGSISYARLIHAKYMVVDGKTLWVGTHNWSGDYFAKMRNISLTLPDSDLAKKARRLHADIWNSAYAKDIRNFRPKP